jgi:hypothetical protein
MHFNPAALFVFAAFCALLVFALSSGSGPTHAAEAVVTVLIAIGVAGFARGRLRG